MTRIARPILLTAFLLAGCQSPPPNRQTLTTLYFGLGRPGATEITQGQWDAFVDAEIVPKFPDGFTLLDGRGRWQERGIGYGEPSRLLIVVHASGDRVVDEKFEAVRALYCRQFGQTSVLRVDQATDRVSF